MNRATTRKLPESRPAQKQQGMAVVGLVIVVLAILSLVGIHSSKSSTLEMKMAINNAEHQKAKLSAESAVFFAWDHITQDIGLDKHVTNCLENGKFDLRDNASVSDCTDPGNTAFSSKTGSKWNDIVNNKEWSWEQSKIQEVLPDKLAIESVPFLNSTEMGDPMQLNQAPQYATGIHAPILLRGTENMYCIPVSVIGAGAGSSDTSMVLIEAKGIPRSGCFRQMF